MRAVRRVLAVTAAVCLALLLGAGPASAHTRLRGSDPADGASVAAAPGTVALTFNEDIAAEFTTLKVIGPDGTEYQTGAVSAVDGTVSTAVSPLGPAGVYRIGYRVVSDDGHPVQGSVSFTLTAPGPGAGAAPSAAVPSAAAPSAPAAAPAAVPVTPAAQAGAPDGGTPVWPWFAGAAVLVVVGAAAALRLGRRVR